MDLKDFFKENPKAALGFSGGVDSSYLLYAATKYGADVRPYYIKTQFQPEFEYRDALKMCKIIGVKMYTVELDALENKEVVKNPENRCYFCKQGLFGTLTSLAKKDGYDLIIDGTNASDDVNDRPGMKALKEMKVRSPLRECGMTKEDIRALSKEAGLFTWNKPAYACLATRIPSGTEITDKLLKRIENAEGAMFDLGFTDFRVRVYNGAARIQIKEYQFEDAAKRRKEILTRLKTYFDVVLLDMETR